jgi:uncharacterized protein (TIGR02284 family)
MVPIPNYEKFNHPQEKYMDTNKTISVLNDLIETSKDGEKGFTECANDLHTASLKSIMVKRSKDCAEAAAELQQLVRSLGGKPEKDTSLSGDLHRRWVGLKELVTDKDDTSILNECERGEDVAKKSYKKALEKELPPEIRNVVEKQYQGVLRNHDQVKALRDAARAR